MLDLQPNSLIRIDEQEFKKIDFEVMGEAYRVQNDLGRTLAEKIYQDELAFRLSKRFDRIETELPVKMSFESFSKTYLADLVVDSRVIYELKAAKEFVGQHRSQLLQYLLMTNLRHGKLVNFGSAKVEGEYVSTRLSTDKRKTFEIDSSHLSITSPQIEEFVELTTNMLHHWGAFLNPELYYDAVVHFFGGAEAVIRTINVLWQQRTIGTQRAHLLSDRVAFKVTAMRYNLDKYRIELKKFLNCTELENVVWLNMNHDKISFETIN